MMPKQSIWMIRLSLFYLLISVSIGGLLFVHKTIQFHPAIWSLLPLHYELAIWGWLVQFVMGTAYWMLPKKLEGERRGPVVPAWCMIILFNTGLILLTISSFFPDLIWSSALGRSLIALSILLYSFLIWPRIVSYRNL